MKPDELVTIATFELPHQADLAKGMMESAGFEVFRFGEHLGRPQLSNWGGPISLQVKSSDEAEARNFLAEVADTSEP
jgi:hypothetical protein